jgi:hypothetical protein
MGLDMYLFRTKKPSYTDETSYFHKEQVDGNPHLYCETFLKFAELTKRKNKYYDEEKINKTFGVKINYVSYMGPDGVGFSCEDVVPEEHQENNEDHLFRGDRTLFISYDDIENFLYEREDEMYAIDLEFVDYQRKGLNDTGWDLIPENVSYSDNKGRITKMTLFGNLSESFITNWVDGETVFHPWW